MIFLFSAKRKQVKMRETEEENIMDFLKKKNKTKQNKTKKTRSKLKLRKKSVFFDFFLFLIDKALLYGSINYGSL